ncbi:MAG: hypothetical protein AB7G04_11360 [Hyphomonadaceae bacterium]
MTARQSAGGFISAPADLSLAALFPPNAPFHAVGVEVMRFWAKRAKSYGDLLMRFADSAAPNELLEAEKKFLEEAMDDYRESASAASRIMSAAVGQSGKTAANGRA